MKYFLKAHIENKELKFNDTDLYRSVITTIGNGAVIICIEVPNPLATEHDFRSEYFSKSDVIRNDLGYSKKEMHDLIKKHVLESIYDDPENLKDPQLATVSTKNLTIIGWRRFMEALRIWSFSQFNIYI